MAAPEGVQTTKTGNITREPSLNYGKSGKAVCRFGLAVNVPVEPGNWAGEKKTTFYEVACFEGLAENVADCLHKGDRVIVQGTGVLREWERDGKSGTANDIAANSVGAELRFSTVAITRNPKIQADQGSAEAAADESPF